jgi:hypothetical protein
MSTIFGVQWIEVEYGWDPKNPGKAYPVRY